MGGAPLANYVRFGRDRVEGWFARTDAEIFRLVLETQARRGLGGAGAEIGVHHGKSCIAMCLGLSPGEKAYCIDIFEDQTLNRDGSGKGDRAVFDRNLARFGVQADRVVVRAASSLDVGGEEIIRAVGPVRLFSIDGGHWFDAVKNDLALAEATLAPHGVVALDDFLRPEWPDVSAGYFAWKARARRALVPFAMGFNKLYLCGADHVGLYQSALAEDPLLGGLIVRWVEIEGRSLPVFTELPLPEHSPGRRWLIQLRVAQPEAYLAWRGLDRRFRGAASAAKRAVKVRGARRGQPVLASADRP